MNVKVKATGQVIPVQKEVGKMILSKGDGTITYTTRGKMKNFKNQQRKKNNNFTFLQAYIKKGKPLYEINSSMLMTIYGKRRLFGIKIDNGQD